MEINKNDTEIELPLGFRERWREAFKHRRRRLSRRLEKP